MGRSPEFDEFYRSAYRPLVVQLYALTCDYAEAEEVAQEAFARAWLAWPRIGTFDDVHAWTRTVAFRIAVSRWRRATRLRRAIVRLAAAPEYAPGPGPISVAVVTALRSLPAPQRRVLVLHYLCDLPLAAIAAEERVGVNTVKSRLSRGRAALSHLLDDEPSRAISMRGTA